MNCLKMRRVSRCCESALVLGLFLPACTGNGNLMLGELHPAGGTDAGAGGASGASGVGGGGGSGWIETDASLFDAPIGEASCAGATVLEPLTPVLYLVVDRSDSMQGNQQQNNKWPDLLDGLTGYLDSSVANQLNVGLGYYPNPCQLRQQPQTCPGMQACLASAYFEPNVPIGSPAALSNYLASTMLPPNGPTALRLALDGALEGYIPDWEAMNPSKFVVPVVVAGGTPQAMDCPPNNVDAVAAVADYAQRDAANSNAHTRTFVIAFELDNPNNTQPFDLIAQAGGTNPAYVLDGRPSPAQEFTNALEAIRRRSCMFRLPSNIGTNYQFGAVRDDPRHPDIVFVVSDTAGDPGSGLGSACGRAEHAFELFKDPSDSTRFIGCDQLCEEVGNGATIQVVPLCQTDPNALR